MAIFEKPPELHTILEFPCRYFELWGYRRKGVDSKDILWKTLEKQIMESYKTSKKMTFIRGENAHCSAHMFFFIIFLFAKCRDITLDVKINKLKQKCKMLLGGNICTKRSNCFFFMEIISSYF